MIDSNTDLAVRESRMDAARASPCASAVSSSGRRSVTALEQRRRRTIAVPPASNDTDEKQTPDALAEKLKRLAKRTSSDEGNHDGRDDSPAS